MALLAAASTGNLIGIGELAAALTVAVATIVFGIPAWRIARNQVKTSRTQELAEAMARYFGIPVPDHPTQPIPMPSANHPTMIDLLTEMRDNSNETAALSAAFAHHVSNGHGGPIPPEIFAKFH